MFEVISPSLCEPLLTLVISVQFALVRFLNSCRVRPISTASRGAMKRRLTWCLLTLPWSPTSATAGVRVRRDLSPGDRQWSVMCRLTQPRGPVCFFQTTTDCCDKYPHLYEPSLSEAFLARVGSTQNEAGLSLPHRSMTLYSTSLTIHQDEGSHACTRQPDDGISRFDRIR